MRVYTQRGGGRGFSVGPNIKKLYIVRQRAGQLVRISQNLYDVLSVKDIGLHHDTIVSLK